MKFFTKKSTIQKIVIICIMILLVNFSLTPIASYADDDNWGIGGTLAKELMQLLAWFGDIVMGGLNSFMLGAGGAASSMLPMNNYNLTDSNSWLYPGNKKADIFFPSGEINTAALGRKKV